MHGLVILLIAFLLAKKVKFAAPVKTMLVTEVDDSAAWRR